MKHLFSTVSFLLTILLFSGCSSDVQQFHYTKEDVAVGESEAEMVSAEETVQYNFSDVGFVLTNDAANSFIVQNDEVSLFYVERGQNIYKVYFNTVYQNLCSFQMTITYDNGCEDEVHSEIINTAQQHYYVFGCNGSAIESVQISMTPVDGEATAPVSFDDEIELLSNNTILSHVNGVIEIYNDYGTAINTLDVSKGVTYVINSGAVKYSVLKEK